MHFIYTLYGAQIITNPQQAILDFSNTGFRMQNLPLTCMYVDVCVVVTGKVKIKM
jgi:hypothetical protein